MAGTFPNDGRPGGSQIQWRHWGDDAFEAAQEEDKPVLLAISAVWCYWCLVMEETTYADPEVMEFVNGNFVAVLVDNDHRPDVNARYNVGGWPTTSLLTPHGGHIAGATYLPADQMLAMLGEVKRAYDEDKAGIYDQAAQLHRQRQEYGARVAMGPEVGHWLVDGIARRMTGAYDARNGGFGEEPKFPAAPILRLFLHLYRTTGEEFYRALLVKTLDGMVEGELYDAVEGGFFRYCAGGDWSEAQHEKMAEDNVSLARVFMEAGTLLEEARYSEVAGRTLDFLMETLLDREAGGFRGSQGAHSEYFGLDEEGRQERAAPEPDPYCYTNWTCQGISLLLEAAWKLPRPELAERALELLEGVSARAEQGRLAHAFDGTGQPSAQLPAGTDLLGDWAAYLNALTDAYNCCPNGTGPDYLARAQGAAEELDRRFYDQGRGGYGDTEGDSVKTVSGSVGYMRLREKPLAENVLVAEALLKLHQATGEDRYRMRVENVLRAYGEANRDFGEHAAAYAVAVDHFLHPPVEITVEGAPGREDTQELVAAAARVKHPHVVVKAAAVESDMAVAHVCVDTLCFPPVSRAEELAASVEEALAGPQGPVGSIFERFVGF